MSDIQKRASCDPGFLSRKIEEQRPQSRNNCNITPPFKQIHATNVNFRFGMKKPYALETPLKF